MWLFLFHSNFWLPNKQTFMLLHFCEFWKACIEPLYTRFWKNKVSILILEFQMTQNKEGLSLNSFHQIINIIWDSAGIIALPGIFPIVSIDCTKMMILKNVSYLIFSGSALILNYSWYLFSRCLSFSLIAKSSCQCVSLDNSWSLIICPFANLNASFSFI